MDILSVPLRFTNDGGFLKVDSTSDEYKAQQVRAMISTHQGERKLFPSFGITDPTFDDFVPEAMLEEFVKFYGDTVVVSKINVIKREGAVKNIEVKFD